MLEFSTEQLTEDIARSLSPEQFDHAAEDFLAAFDALNDRTIQQTGAKLHCHAGCSICCTLRVDVFAHEVFLIAHHIRSHFSAEETALLFGRLAAHAEKVLALTPFEHATQNIVCPLLQNGRCSIYTVRPQSCRRHHSQDFAACEFTYEHPDDLEFPGAHHRDLFRILTGAMQQNIDAYSELGFDHTIYELGTALAEALHETGSELRWRARDQAFIHASVTPAA
jgi:Fe-S-cluster containining protein